MRLVIIGAGGHGNVVKEMAMATKKYDEITFLDDSLENKCKDFIHYINQETEFYIAFGNNEARYRWIHELLAHNAKLATIIHPLAYISPSASIGGGCVVMPYAIVNTNTVIKQGCIINIGALVDHDCVIEEACHIAPGGIVKAMNRLPCKTKVEGGKVIPLNYYK